jgi:hypothetical protein
MQSAILNPAKKGVTIPIRERLSLIRRHFFGPSRLQNFPPSIKVREKVGPPKHGNQIETTLGLFAPMTLLTMQSDQLLESHISCLLSECSG